MIGFYDYTVVVTYISLVSSILGMFCAIDGRLTLAVSCLAFSGLCDMFDGKIARTKKNRTDEHESSRHREQHGRHAGLHNADQHEHPDHRKNHRVGDAQRAGA